MEAVIEGLVKLKNDTKYEGILKESFNQRQFMFVEKTSRAYLAEMANRYGCMHFKSMAEGLPALLAAVSRI